MSVVEENPDPAGPEGSTAPPAPSPRGPSDDATADRLGRVLVVVAVAVTLALGLSGGVFVVFLAGMSQRAPDSVYLSVAVLAVVWSLGGALLIGKRRPRWRLTGAGILIVALVGTGLVGRYLADGLDNVLPAGDAGEVVRVCGLFEFYRTDRLALAAVHRDFPGVPAKVAIGCRGGEVEVRVGPFVAPGRATRLMAQEDVEVGRRRVTVAPYSDPAEIAGLFPEIVAQTPSLGAGPRRCLLRGTQCVGLGCEHVPPFEIWCVKAGTHRTPESCVENETGCGYVPLDLPGY